MPLVYAILASLSTAVFAGIVIYIFTKIISNKIISLKNKSERRPLNRMALKEIMLAVKEDPDSKRSKKIRLMIACIAFLLFQLIVWKIIFSFIVSAGVYLAIGTYYGILRKKTLDAFDDQLLDGLGIITNSVRSGQSLQQGIENMIKETKPPFSSEFAMALQEVRLGVSLEESLKNITKRVNSKNLSITVTSMNLAKETGGNIGEILTRLADTMRERKKIQSKVKALTAQGKTSGYIVGAAPFIMAVILSLIEPSMFGLIFSTTLGNLMLLVVIFFVAVGMFFINRIVDINI